MNKLLCILLALSVTTLASAQWPWSKIDGNGNKVKQTRSVGRYTAVASSGFWDVMIAYGESNSIEIEGDENLLEYIETKVEGNTLSIDSKKHFNLRSKNRIVVYVTLTRMTGVSLSGSGDIIGKGKFRNDGTTTFHVSGSGSIKIDLDKVDAAEVGISGSGGIRLTGSASSVDARISGSGNIDCSDLISDNATARVSGSGNIKLNANKSLEASIAGSGNVSYKGIASDVRKHISGSGRVSRLG